MKPLRAVLRRLDPWAALLLGVLVALGVIILLATPGPWHRVVGPATSVTIIPPPPDDVAVFVVGGTDDPACTGVLWIHVDYDAPSLTAVVVAPVTEAFVPGGGFAPVRRLVGDIGPGPAAAALGRDLGVTFDAWAVLPRSAMRLAVPALFPAPQTGMRGGSYKNGVQAWALQDDPVRAWPRQYASLRVALPLAPFDGINIVGFTNYVLGFGYVQSNLNLQGAASLGRTLVQLTPPQVYVRAAPAIAETCRGRGFWRVDQSGLTRLHAALALDLRPPTAPPRVSHRPRPARVLVVLPLPEPAGAAYVRSLRRNLALSAGAPVGVVVLHAGPGGATTARVRRALETAQPLAVLLAPGLSSAAGTEAAARLSDVAAMLARAGQPAVVSEPLPAGGGSAASPGPGAAALLAAARLSGLPVATLDGLPLEVASTASARASGRRALAARLAARDNAQTLVRACWPQVLAPRLTGTRLGFGYAARRRTMVLTLAATLDGARRAAARLQVWGYRTRVLDGSAWRPPETGRVVYYHRGFRRPALALAGDLGLAPTSVVADDQAPGGVVYSLEK